ncbi:MAG: ribosomal L7Ae/L30e/S12e/Gadd45 family protein [Clostridia bacterium]|nr:ribosomal L7Ae/L30e/S12e/Gadd45 family protein [Clostridia bacterium]
MSPYERLQKAKRKIAGTRQTTKAVQQGAARVVYVARDAEPHVTQPLVAMCADKAIEAVWVDSMYELGKACGIEVKTASAAIIEE